MIEIYTKENCGFCTKAKNLFKIKGFDFQEHDLLKEGEKENMIARFQQNNLPMPRTVPQIFINGEYIGGYDDYIKKVGLV